MRPADSEGFLAIHRVPEGGARILLRPYAGQPAGIFQAHIHGAADQDAGEAALDRTVGVGMQAEEIVLAIGAGAVVAVGPAGHANLYGL